MNAIEILTANTTRKPVDRSFDLVVDEAIITSVSSPSAIKAIAEDRGINPQEVFVRIQFSYKGETFKASNKLRFLTKAGYEELLSAMKNKTPMRLVVNTESEFFYIEKDVSVDDLFAEKVNPTVKVSTLDKLKAIVG